MGVVPVSLDEDLSDLFLVADLLPFDLDVLG